MKHLLFLVLAISLTGAAHANYNNKPVSKAAAPSSDKSITDRQNGQEKTYHDYDNSDAVQTGQSATKREYQYDSNVKSCRSLDGTWLRTGDRGFAACMDDTRTMKK